MRKTWAAAAASLVLAGCLGGARGGRWKPLPRISEAAIEAATPPLALPPADDEIPGTPPMRVTWEALAVEAHQMQNPRYAPPTATGFRVRRAELKIVLLNASHPEAVKMRRRAAESRSQRFEAEIAIIGDADMNDLVATFEKMGVFRYAKATGSVSSLFASENARGRITVERGGESVTLLSQRGLGLVDATRPIQGIYSDAKKAVSVMKNRTPTLSVTHFGTSTPGTRPR